MNFRKEVRNIAKVKAKVAKTKAKPETPSSSSDDSSQALAMFSCSKMKPVNPMMSCRDMMRLHASQKKIRSSTGESRLAKLKRESDDEIKIVGVRFSRMSV